MDTTTKVRVVRGTSYFPSIADAYNHFRPYYGSPYFTGGDTSPIRDKRTKDDECHAAVQRKLASGEIHIGKPKLEEGEELIVKDDRYHIAKRV